VGQFRIIESGVAERLILSSGNLGLGVTPSAWGAAGGIDFPGGGGVGNWGLSGNATWLSSNTYFASGNYRYKNTNTAAQYIVGNGSHSWFTAPSGTAGNAITFTQAMTLDAVGNLGVGVTSIPSYTNYKGIAVGGVVGGTIDFIASNTGAGQNRAAQIFSVSGALAFATGASDVVLERLRIGSAGQIGIGGANYGTSGQVLTSGGSGAAPSWASVGTATAGLAWAAVGTYAFLGTSATVAPSTTLANPGDTLAGSTLRAIGVYSFGTAGVQVHGTELSGTWRVMGFLRNISASNSHQVGTLCLRIS
jgi:hypothetical protein